MSLISILLLIVFIIASILLLIIVLIQDEQGEGIGGIFGGGSSTPFGSRSGNVLTRFTTTLGAIFLISAFALAWVSRSTEGDDITAAGARARAATETTAVDWWKADSEAAAPVEGSPAPQSTVQPSAAP